MQHTCPRFTCKYRTGHDWYGPSAEPTLERLQAGSFAGQARTPRRMEWPGQSDAFVHRPWEPHLGTLCSSGLTLPVSYLRTSALVQSLRVVYVVATPKPESASLREVVTVASSSLTEELESAGPPPAGIVGCRACQQLGPILSKCFAETTTSDQGLLSPLKLRSVDFAHVFAEWFSENPHRGLTGANMESL